MKQVIFMAMIVGVKSPISHFLPVLTEILLRVPKDVFNETNELFYDFPMTTIV